jgi:hypothetical protein
MKQRKLGKGRGTRRRHRALGAVTADLEPLLFELVDHDLQHGEILNLVRGWLEIHAPGARERYDEGGSPLFYFGPASGWPYGE